MIYRNLSSYFRSLVAGADTKIPIANGKYVTAINFDNAATTPPLCSVLKEIACFAPWYASVHRGKGYKSILTSERYDHGREVVKQFVKADKHDVVVFTKNTTESINMLAYALATDDKQQVVLSTDMEHLANDLPWRDKFTIDYVAITSSGRLSLENLALKLQTYEGRVKLVTVTGASNVTGYINPIHTIARLAHKYGAKIFVDGAQWVPHTPVDMKPYDSPEHIDYLTFSAHKMYAPFGAGVLIGAKETFEQAIPVYQGGGAVGLVSQQTIEWDSPPAKYEAGTPNMMGVLALITAIETLSRLNIGDIHNYERKLIDYAIGGLSTIPGITLYSTRDRDEERVSLVSFSLEGMHHSQVAEILSQEAGIAVRNGLFCAHPYVEKLLNLSEKEISHYQTQNDKTIPGLVRISFGIYNNLREIEGFLDLLSHVAKHRQYYARKYSYVLAPDRCGDRKKDDLYC
ncbi:aminotransferase class V-fold PLP-dependent enzyme [Sporomusa malonica]|uniref:Selenocysteine lyase/Cysteine desulfurase n=1 Tax=Sporomusa malonica TaxID=112901 RepID=A0A1W2CCM3_9FIRM|nr:aminotransferase class V-fold PLP-dependent enzyme [Sporomusa malonica]SMC82428.1 Selenocysteine lyase/Cysteine desulfurase [Sporomusa malonica]